MAHKQQEIWLKAAVIGSIWASFEIVFGGFFHSLRLPFAGTFLTFSSIVLLTAFSYKWQDKNLFIKAGIVAALMRSLMPTSIILGPLIGILIEAFFFQLFLNLLGRNFMAYALAGIMAMFSAIMHKIISIILIYGLDIVKILENLYYVFLHITHMKLPLNQLITTIAISYIFLGTLAAVTGQYVGKKLLKQGVVAPIDMGQLAFKNNLFDIEHFKYQSKYIFIHLIVLILFLIGLEIYPLQYLIGPILIYMIFIFKRYGKSLRRLAKPLFWIQLIIIVLMAVWLWDNKIQGLLVGIKMILRAILVVSAFTAISVELKNPLVKALLYKKGYSQLYATLGLATSAVPFILKNISQDKKTLFKPLKVLQQSISLSDTLLQEFKRQIYQKNKIFIISGETRSGKTTFLKAVIDDLKERAPQIKIGGIIAYGVDYQGERFGFKIENIATCQKEYLCSQQAESPEDQKIGRFYFSQNGLNFGRQAITSHLNQIDLLVVDEIGYLELQGKGWFEAIEKAMNQPNLNMIFVVRKRILEQILNLWQNKHFIVVDIDNNTPDYISKIISTHTNSK